jgi:hypothetical protein
MSGRRVFIGGRVDKRLKSEFLRYCGREVWENGRPVKISQNQLLLIFLTEGVERRLKVQLQQTDVKVPSREFASSSR